MNGNIPENTEAFKMGERLARIEGNVNLVHSKLEGIEISISNLTNGIGQRVGEHDKMLSKLEERVGNSIEETEKIERKIDKHLEKHWIWISSVIGIISIVGMVAKYIK